ncbi:LOW QUALITY PROTEIN: AP-5 complex subunit sigma-1-like, partial [Thalassophryne amazonica]|uniref:LOW QUALITY PROTEIN: AP-5 complex subunit sigma-1-like n=1 Tax=Thalassophryne amazonica TaxID=390379 RepID=UPI001470D4FE
WDVTVRCFLVHTVCCISSVGAGVSRVIYSRAFGPDESTVSVQNREFGPEERRPLQREKLAVLARQVRSAVSLSQEASGKLVVEMVPGEEGAALQEADSGVLRLRAGDLFCDELSVLWLGISSLVFKMAYEPHDNLILAETTLCVVAQFMAKISQFMSELSSFTGYAIKSSQVQLNPTVHVTLN